MKRFLILASALAVTSFVDAAHVPFIKKSTSTAKPTSTVKSKPRPPTQHYYIKAEYLFMRPYEDGLNYATVHKNVGFVDSNTTKAKTKNPNFEWSSGGRLYLGFLFPNFDHWDFSLIGTYLHNTTRDVTRPSQPFDPNTYIASISFPDPDWGPGTGADFVGKAESRWTLNYTTVDLPLGRNWKVSSHFALHPHIGLRGAVINQSDHVNYKNSLFPIRPDNFFFENTKFFGQNNFWGIGPRIGTTLFFNFNSHWSLLGTAAGSLLFGKHRVNEKLNSRQANGAGVPPIPIVLKSHNNNTVLRSNIEGSVGASWNTLFNRNKARVTIAATFEASEWFSQNQLYNVLLTAILPGNGGVNGAQVVSNQISRNGDFALVGGTASIQFDF